MKWGFARFFALALLQGLMGCGGSPAAPGTPPSSTPPPVATIPPDVSAAVRAMLEAVPSYITTALSENQENLPRNPNNAAQINAKIALLQRPTLVNEIYSWRFWVEAAAASSNGRSIPIVAVFPVEQMRGEATDAVRALERALIVLEEFMRTPYLTAEIRLWYGFKIGNSGGGGTLYMEDRTTYESRTPVSRLPFNAILFHELSHTYIGNESLTQFLEVYVYNVVQGGSPQLATWNYLRGWTPMLADNKDLAAVLDVYQLIERDAMSGAYAAVVPLRPPYGQPLSPLVIQMFVDRAPSAAKPQVGQKLAQVTF